MVAVILNGTVSKDEGRGEGRRWSGNGDRSWKWFRTRRHLRDHRRTQQKKPGEGWREEIRDGRRWTGYKGMFEYISEKVKYVDC